MMADPDADKLRELEKVLAGLLHDARAPIATIASAIEALADERSGRLTINQAKLVDIADGTAQRLFHLIDDVLVYQQVHINKSVHLLPSTLDDVVHGTFSQREMEGFSVQLEIHAEDAKLALRSDLGLLAWATARILRVFATEKSVYSVKRDNMDRVAFELFPTKVVERNNSSFMIGDTNLIDEILDLHSTELVLFERDNLSGISFAIPILS